MIPESHWYYMNVVASSGSIEAGASLLFTRLNLPVQVIIEDEEGNRKVEEHPPIRFTSEEDAENIAIECMRMIQDAAPDSIRDDLGLCCAHHIYRSLLIDAVDNGSIDVMMNAQNEILRLTQGQ